MKADEESNLALLLFMKVNENRKVHLRHMSEPRTYAWICYTNCSSRFPVTDTFRICSDSGFTSIRNTINTDMLCPACTVVDSSLKVRFGSVSDH